MSKQGLQRVLTEHMNYILVHVVTLVYCEAVEVQLGGFCLNSSTVL